MGRFGAIASPWRVFGISVDAGRKPSGSEMAFITGRLAPSRFMGRLR